MASIPGSHYDIFAPKQTVNFGVTTDPNNVPAPVAGAFNLEVVTNGTGTGSFTTAPGYQGLAVLSADGHTLTLLHGITAPWTTPAAAIGSCSATAAYQ